MDSCLLIPAPSTIKRNAFLSLYFPSNAPYFLSFLLNIAGGHYPIVFLMISVMVINSSFLLWMIWQYHRFPAQEFFFNEIDSFAVLSFPVNYKRVSYQDIRTKEG